MIATPCCGCSCVNSSSAAGTRIAARERHRADDRASRFAAAQCMNLGARLLDFGEGEARAARQLLRPRAWA